MKFILTGCTGFIGSEVISQCIRHPSITSIVALSRRSLPETVSHPKLKTIIMQDFNSYPDSLLEELSGADACIWCMGTTKGDKAYTTNPEEKVSVFALKWRDERTRREQALGFLSKFETNEEGVAEENMIGFQKKGGSEGLWETVIVKAAFVITEAGISPRDMFGWILGDRRAIRVNELAAMMIGVALNGSAEETIQDNLTMVSMGRDALKRMNG